MSRNNNYTPHIAPEEWRWAILASGVLAILTLMPYVLALAGNNAASDAQFMGILINPLDGASYLAKMEQGYQKDILFHLPFTPEPHNGSVIFLFYIFLGHLARISGLSPIIIFHMTRALAGLFMFIALYQLGAAVWTRQRPRRFFFGLTAVGSGLGWLAIVIDHSLQNMSGNRIIPDLNMPEAFPLYSVYVNPHFPLTIGMLALVGSIYIHVFRPGTHEEPTIYNQGMILALASILLALLMPQSLVPIGITLGVYLIVRYVKTRKFPLYEASWCIPLWLPAAPFATYYIIAIQANQAIKEWNAQNITLSPPVYLYLISFAPLLFVAIPGLLRALRHFEADGDQFMLTWLLINAALLYAPVNAQRRFSIGLIIPLAYFAVRALEDYWINVIPDKALRPTLIGLFVILLPSHVLAMGIPPLSVVTISKEDIGTNSLMLEHEYVSALGWIRNNVPLETDGRKTVILAASNFSTFIPAWSGQTVVYAHPYETLDAVHKEAMVNAWYRGEECQALLNGATWHGRKWQVDYVVVGPRERALGEDANGELIPNADACYKALGEPIMLFGETNNVALYKVDRVD